MGYHGPCKKLQAPISPTGSPETTSSRPWPQWPNRSWRLPYTKSTGRSPQKSFPGYQKKVISKRNHKTLIGWLEVGVKNTMVNKPIIQLLIPRSAVFQSLRTIWIRLNLSAVFTPLNWGQPVNPDSIRFVWKSFGWLNHHPSSPNRPDLGLKIGERYIFFELWYICNILKPCSSM